MGDITKGNVDDPKAAALAFWEAYGDHCFKAPEFHIDDLTVESFKAVCQCSKSSAAGLDGWSAGDLSLLSDEALQIIVNVLNAIERGAPGPLIRSIPELSSSVKMPMKLRTRLPIGY